MKNVLIGDEIQDILIDETEIQTIGKVEESIEAEVKTVIEGKNKLAVPTLHNGHTHAGMTLFRGFGDDLPLQTWLEDTIWPLEEQLTADDVYWATRLACLEMIQTGTTFFNDMYWEFDSISRAVEDSGIRAMVSGVFIDRFNEDLAKQQRKQNEKLFHQFHETSDRINFALGPHSIYTVSSGSLEWIADFSRRHNLPVHIHLAETERELEECRDQHGTTPVRYLDELNFLHQNVIVAHGIWIDDEEIKALADNNVSVVYNPLSNLKLSAGDNFRYTALKEAGVPLCLGTDGVASNNNLNLLEEIKIASLLQKNRLNDTTAVPAEETYRLATQEASRIFDLNTGNLKEGKKADIMLINRDHPSMSLSDVHDVYSHLSYVLTPEAIDTVICNGNILMHDGELIEGEVDRVIRNHRRRTRDLCY